MPASDLLRRAAINSLDRGPDNSWLNSQRDIVTPYGQLLSNCAKNRV